MAKKVIDVFVNKNQEFEVCMKMIKKSEYFREIFKDKHLKENYFVRHPLLRNKDKKYPDLPSAIYEDDNFIINFRCIAYLAVMEMPDGAIDYEGRSSYAGLMSVYCAIIEDKPDYIISLSTAQSTKEIQGENNISVNGSVVMGRNFFLADEKNEDKEKRFHVEFDQNGNASKIKYEWKDMQFCETGCAVIESKEDNSFFDCIKKINQKEIELYEAEFNPSVLQRVVYDDTYISIGVQNVSNSRSYQLANSMAHDKFIKSEHTNFKAACIENAHGVVAYAATLDENEHMESNMKTRIPILFVSPIAKGYSKNEPEIKDKDEKDYQKRICGVNGGIVVSEILRLLMESEI